jgi:hypothetical protein
VTACGTFSRRFLGRRAVGGRRHGSSDCCRCCSDATPTGSSRATARHPVADAGCPAATAAPEGARSAAQAPASRAVHLAASPATSARASSA